MIRIDGLAGPRRGKRSRTARLLALAGSVAALAGPALAASPGPAVQAGRTPETAPPPVWKEPLRAPAGAPNVLVIMTDDVGFGASSTFGGPIPTPAFDALAASGVRYNRFHTSALCSPTRAALLTGRNPHSVEMGNVTNLATAYPGYTTVIPKSAATIAEVLRQSGYNTAMFGKGHITPDWEQSQAGPFDRWPTGLGFEYFYGFLNADASQFEPALVRNTTPVDPAAGRPDYILDADLADDAIGWLEQQRSLAPDKPFFLYYAPGTAHTPHHAPKEWLAKFRGRFDAGWDRMREETFARQKKQGVVPADAKLTPRPASLPAWASLNGEQKRLYARYMEAYAAALAFADHEIGRVIQQLKDDGRFENTLIVYIQGDNGGSAEGTLEGLMFEQSTIARTPETWADKMAAIDEIGGPKLYNHFPAAWGWALNAPFPHYKQVASHLGGTRNGLVMSWPGRIPEGGSVRNQFHYVSDIFPTILEAAQIAPPESVNGHRQQPLDGISMVYSFAQPKAPSQRTTQLFEMMQNMAVYKDGWLAGTTPARAAWELAGGVKTPVDQRRWELYNLNADFSQSRDLAAKEPARLKALQEEFWKQAAEGRVLPIHGSAQGEGRGEPPSLTNGRTEFVYTSRIRRVPQDTAPHIINRSFSIEAQVVVPPEGGQGVILAQGGRFSGYSLALDGGKPVFTYNAVPPHISVVGGAQPLAPGAHVVTVDFDYDGGGAGKGGTAKLSVDGVVQAEGRISKTVPRWISHTEGLDVGADTTSPVSAGYASPAEFNGDIKKVVIRLR